MSFGFAYNGFDGGFQPGFDYGYQPGFDVGFQPGFDVGFQPGFDVGFQPGFDVGFQPGFDVGFQPGFDVGFQPGFDVGFQPGFGGGDNFYETVAPLAGGGASFGRFEPIQQDFGGYAAAFQPIGTPISQPIRVAAPAAPGPKNDKFVNRSFVVNQTSAKPKAEGKKKERVVGGPKAHLYAQSIPRSDSYVRLYGRNYVVTPQEMDKIRQFFTGKKEITLSEFQKLSAEICPQPGVEQLAEDSFQEFDHESSGKLDFDTFLVAYAFVRYRKYGGSDRGLVGGQFFGF